MISILALATSYSLEYTVERFSGRVEVMSDGDWVPIQTGMILTDSSEVRTGIGASLTITEDARRAHVLRGSGTVKSLIDANPARITITGGVNQVDVEVRTRTTARVPTASARASDAAGDLEFQE